MTDERKPGTMSAQLPPQKSVILAYLFWLVGGIFGLHHFYLGRDRHAFVWFTTFGGYFGMGWLSDAFSIPKYVRDANDDPRFITEFVYKLRSSPKPPFSINRFVGMIMLGYFWGQLVLIALPEDEFFGVDWRFLEWSIPLGISLGVWTVGNIGREKGSIWLSLVTAYVSYPLVRMYVFDETIWLTAVTFCSAYAFDAFSKQWRRDPPKRRSFIKRVVVLGMCASLYFSLWGAYLFFNGKVTDSDGEEIPLHEAVHHFFTSPWWTDLKNSFNEIWLYAQHHGWYEVWKQIIDLSDPRGEYNAYKVLGVSQSATQSEITARWRMLSRENHPDKVKDPEKRSEAQDKFMEIQQAYEILSKIKNKRRRKNKIYSGDHEE